MTQIQVVVTVSMTLCSPTDW